MEAEDNEVQKIQIPGGRLPIIGSLLSFIGLFVYGASQHPGRGGPVVILGFLLLVFVAFTSLSALGLQLIARIFKIKFTPIRLAYTAILLGLGIVFLVGLQTLHQLQVIDVILLVLFEVLLNFYVLRRF